MKRIGLREQEMFGTVVRWAGLGMLGYAFFIDKLRNPALLPAATSMIFYKSIVGSRNGNGR